MQYDNYIIAAVFNGFTVLHVLHVSDFLRTFKNASLANSAFPLCLKRCARSRPVSMASLRLHAKCHVEFVK